MFLWQTQKEEIHRLSPGFILTLTHLFLSLMLPWFLHVYNGNNPSTCTDGAAVKINPGVWRSLPLTIPRIIIRLCCPNRLTRWCLGWQRSAQHPVTHAVLLPGPRRLLHGPSGTFPAYCIFCWTSNSSLDPLARMRLSTFKLGSPLLKFRLVEWLGGRGPEGKGRDVISRRLWSVFRDPHPDVSY